MVHLLQVLRQEQTVANKELGVENKYSLVFQLYGYIHYVLDIATVNKAMKKMFEELDIYPAITTKGAHHTYASGSLWTYFAGKTQ